MITEASESEAKRGRVMSDLSGTRGPRPSGPISEADAERANEVSQKRILALARTWLGTPYHHQASVKGVGCDCLGLVRGVYEEACGRPAETPPPYSRDWAEASRRETMIEAARRHLIPIDPKDAAPGDVRIFRLRPGAMAKHAAIMTEAPEAHPGSSPGQTAKHAPIPPDAPGARPESSPGQTAMHAVVSPEAPGAHGQVGQRAADTKRANEVSPAKMIHAIEGAPASEVHITPWWRRRIAAAFRFPPQEMPHAQPLQQP